MKTQTKMPPRSQFALPKQKRKNKSNFFLFVGKISGNYDMNKVAEKDVKVWLEKALSQEIDISKLLKRSTGQRKKMVR